MEISEIESRMKFGKKESQMTVDIDFSNDFIVVEKILVSMAFVYTLIEKNHLLYCVCRKTKSNYYNDFI